MRKVGFEFKSWKNIQGHLQCRLFPACENRDFQQADGAESHGFAAPRCRFKRSQLGPGELSGFE